MTKVLSSQQWGFRSLHSTALALIDCSSNWLFNVDRGKNNLTVFFDIKKSFDAIDHNILLRKLDYYGISKEELPFLKSYLSECRQCCNVDGFKSSFRPIKCGVPQGSILGPLLFIIYMNDLPNCIEHGHVTMYADDTSSLKSCRDIEENVIRSMINICDWLKANKLSLNTTKTDFMLIGSTHNNKKFDNLLAIRVGNELIRRTHVKKYLGLIVDDTLKWDLHIDYISKKIKKNIGLMKHVKFCIPKESLAMLYKTLVEPYLRYCNTTWGKCGQQLISKLQTLQNRAATVVTRIKYEEADHDLLLASLGWMNVRQLVYYDTASLMYEIQMEPHQNTHSLFNKCGTIHSYETRSARNRNFIIPKMNSVKGQAAFVYFGAQVWNSLPLCIKEARSIEIF